MTRARKTTGSYTTGEKGRNRVRLYPRSASGALYLEWHDAAGTKQRRALLHRDWALGKADADALAANLSRGRPTGRVSLGTLFDMYEAQKMPDKGRSAQSHNRSALAMFRATWDMTRPAASLDRADWDRFIRLRRSGQIRPAGRPLAPVRAQIVEQDMKFLRAIYNWGLTMGHEGGSLIERNPFTRLPLAKEENPQRPMVTGADFARLRIAAPKVSPLFDAFLLLCHETGHRSQSVRMLRWRDVDMTAAEVRWRADSDKIGFEHFTPLSPDAVKALESASNISGQLGDGWVFPSPRTTTTPISRELLHRWWIEAEVLAELPRVPRRGFHSLRRKFATELRHLPLKDLQLLGGWKDHTTILKCYQQPNLEDMREGLSRRLRLVG